MYHTVETLIEWAITSMALAFAAHLLLPLLHMERKALLRTIAELGELDEVKVQRPPII